MPASMQTIYFIVGYLYAHGASVDSTPAQHNDPGASHQFDCYEFKVQLLQAFSPAVRGKPLTEACAWIMGFPWALNYILTP